MPFRVTFLLYNLAGASGRSSAAAGGGGLKEEARLLERMSTAVATILGERAGKERHVQDACAVQACTMRVCKIHVDVPGCFLACRGRLHSLSALPACQPACQPPTCQKHSAKEPICALLWLRWLAVGADSLLAAVEAKAKASYRSRAQVALHMVNNAHFLVRAAEGRELRAVGDSWLEAHKVGLGLGCVCVRACVCRVWVALLGECSPNSR